MPGFGCFRIRSALALAATAWAAITLVTPSAFGQPPLEPAVPATAESADLSEVLERLRAAERRIAELEANGKQGAAAEGDASAAVPAGRARVSDDAESGDRADSGGKQPTNDSAADNRDAGDGDGGSDVGERLGALQKDWDAFQESQAELKAAAKKKPTFKIGGRIHLDYWTFPGASEGIGFFEHPVPSDPQYGVDPEDRFLFRRIRLEAQGDVPDLMFWRTQVDFNEPENPQIKDVYLGFRLPYDQSLVIGHQKLPMGLDALYSSRFTTFMERPQVNDAFVTDYRRLGAMMYGYSEDLLFNWRYGIFEVQDIQNTGRYIGDSLQLGGYGRLASTPWYDETSDGRGYLHLGASGSVVRPDGDVTAADSNGNVARFSARPEGRTDMRWIDTGPIRGAQWFEQTGLEAVLNVGALQFTGELMGTWVQRDETTRGTGPDTLFHGGYVQAAYLLTGEYVPWDREQGVVDRVKPFENFFLIDRCGGGTGGGWGAWQVAARYDYLDLTDADIRGGVENNMTYALNWWWNPYARLQFNVTHGLIEQHREVGGFDSGDFWLAGTRFAIDF